MDITKGKFWSRAWSLIDGCTPVSAGCDHCWLASQEKRFRQYAGRVNNGAFNGSVTFREDRLDIPLTTRKPTVFAIWSDLYHEKVEPFQIKRVFDLTSNVQKCGAKHTFLIVTKRPERASQWHSSNPWPDNTYHLITVENQEMADRRIPYALQIPGRVGLLIEPMLGPVDIGKYLINPCHFENDPLAMCLMAESIQQGSGQYFSAISCVLLGGETGPGARPMHPDWALSVRDRCQAAGVPFMLKSLGEWIDSFDARDMGLIKSRESAIVRHCEDCEMVRVGAKKAGRALDGRTHDELPWKV